LCVVITADVDEMRLALHEGALYGGALPEPRSAR
jgi:hypothetical protein